jgi:hypothetical protein
MFVHTQPFNALEGVFCEKELCATTNIQLLDALEVCKYCTSQLRAVPDAQTVNALELRKGSIRDSEL